MIIIRRLKKKQKEAKTTSTVLILIHPTAVHPVGNTASMRCATIM